MNKHMVRKWTPKPATKIAIVLMLSIFVFFSAILAGFAGAFIGAIGIVLGALYHSLWIGWIEFIEKESTYE